jgi:hypothetical protein
MVAFDWAAMIDAVLTGIGAVVTAIITALTTNATAIASFVVGALLTGAVVKFGNKALKGFSSLIKKLF